jgi:hypothetical protein
MACHVPASAAFVLVAIGNCPPADNGCPEAASTQRGKPVVSSGPDRWRAWHRAIRRLVCREVRGRSARVPATGAPNLRFGASQCRKRHRHAPNLQASRRADRACAHLGLSLRENVLVTSTVRDQVAISGHPFLAAAGQILLSAHTSRAGRFGPRMAHSPFAVCGCSAIRLVGAL